MVKIFTNRKKTSCANFIIQDIDPGELVEKTDFYTKTEDIEMEIANHNKYITVNVFNKFSSTVFDERLKQAKLTTNDDLNTIEQRAIKNEEKIENLITFDLSYFLVLILLVKMVFKISLFIKPHLVC